MHSSLALLLLQDRTPLHAAATPEIVHELVARGANVTDKDKLVKSVV